MIEISEAVTAVFSQAHCSLHKGSHFFVPTKTIRLFSAAICLWAVKNTVEERYELLNITCVCFGQCICTLTYVVISYCSPSVLIISLVWIAFGHCAAHRWRMSHLVWFLVQINWLLQRERFLFVLRSSFLNLSALFFLRPVHFSLIYVFTLDLSAGP